MEYIIGCFVGLIIGYILGVTHEANDWINNTNESKVKMIKGKLYKNVCLSDKQSRNMIRHYVAIYKEDYDES